MATTDDTELALLIQDTDLDDIELRSVANDHEETRLSLFPNFYAIEFGHHLRGAEIEQSVRFSCVVVKLPDAEAKQKLSADFLAHAKLTLDETRQVIKAEHSGSHLNEKFYTKWTQEVVSEISEQGLGVYRYGIVHLGFRAAEVKQQIEKKMPAVLCELNEENLTLLFYSQKSDLVRQALELAENAKPSNDLASEFVTPNGIKVSLCKQDITTVPTDGVISAVDELISCGGGVSLAILNAVGPEMRKEIDDFLKTNQTLGETEVLATTGRPKWRTVLHARGPRWGGYTEEDCSKQLTRTVYNCFRKANELGLTSISVPFISARTFEVPPEVCAESYKRAIDMLDTDAGNSNITLKKILFVDVSEERVAQVQRSMSQNMERSNTLRIVLVGKAGVGKSSTGNSILSRYFFKTQQALSAVTTESKLGSVDTMFGIDVEVVDSPGLFDKDDDQHEQRLMKELLKTFVYCLPGPHVFFLVFSGKERFGRTEEDVCKTFKALFSGPDCESNLMDFVIVVFTRIKSKEHLEALLQTAPPSLTDLLQKCKNRKFGINNPKILNTPQNDNTTTAERPPEDIEQLMKAAMDLRERNGGQSAYFTSDLLRQILQLVQSDEYKDKNLHDIKREVEEGRGDKLIDKLAGNKKASNGILNALKNLLKKK